MHSVLKIVWPAVLLALIGCSRSKEGDNYTHVKNNDPAMDAAIQKAKSSINEFTVAFHAQQNGTREFYVKKPYSTPAGEQEHMWIEVLDEHDGLFKGRIANEAEETKEVKMGDQVSLKSSEISDWKYQNGRKLIGGYTIRYFLDKMSAKERAAFLQQSGLEL